MPKVLLLILLLTDSGFVPQLFQMIQLYIMFPSKNFLDRIMCEPLTAQERQVLGKLDEQDLQEMLRFVLENLCFLTFKRSKFFKMSF